MPDNLKTDKITILKNKIIYSVFFIDYKSGSNILSGIEVQRSNFS